MDRPGSSHHYEPGAFAATENGFEDYSANVTVRKSMRMELVIQNENPISAKNGLNPAKMANSVASSRLR